MSVEAMDNSERASSPDSAPQTPGENGSPTNGISSKRKNSKSSKPRLTPMQKNTNHKDAENKRRTAIRERFAELANMVPDAAGQERSEQVMLNKTKDYLQVSMAEIRELEAICEQRGIQTNDIGRLRDIDYGGAKWKQPNLERYEKAKVKKAAKSQGGPDDIGDIEDDG